MKYVARSFIGLSVAMSGCGTSYSLKEFSPAEGAPKSAFIDIKQRAVLAATRDSKTILCAEPSPDAMSSFASELALDAKYKETVAASLALSQQEAASFVGLRTQTIQLLRDGMYRLCEGYMSGALTAADFAWLSRRYQRNMVALLTIEQLTRVAQVPAIAHASQGLASASRSVTAIQSDLAELNHTKTKLSEEKAKLDADLKTAQALPDTDTEKKAKVDAASKLVDEKQSAIAEIDELRAALLEGLKTAKGLLASGSTTVQIISTGVVDAQATRSNEVAKEIGKLTAMVLNQNDLPTLCFQLLTGERAPTKVGSALDKLIDNCSSLVGAQIQVEMQSSTPMANQPALQQSSIFLTHHLPPGTFPLLDATPSEQLPIIQAPQTKKKESTSEPKRTPLK